MTHAVRVPFSIGKYKDEVICDVVPMKDYHILLERLWQYDCGSMHNGKTNQYTCTLGGKNYTLLPMSPKDILDSNSKKTNQKLMRENTTCKCVFAS